MKSTQISAELKAAALAGNVVAEPVQSEGAPSLRTGPVTIASPVTVKPMPAPIAKSTSAPVPAAEAPRPIIKPVASPAPTTPAAPPATPALPPQPGAPLTKPDAAADDGRIKALESRVAALEAQLKAVCDAAIQSARGKADALSNLVT